MAKVAPNSSPTSSRSPSKTPWGVPLVLPHVLLSIGLLVFATMSERAAPPRAERPTSALHEAGPVVVSIADPGAPAPARKI